MSNELTIGKLATAAGVNVETIRALSGDAPDDLFATLAVGDVLGAARVVKRDPSAVNAGALAAP